MAEKLNVWFQDSPSLFSGMLSSSNTLWCISQFQALPSPPGNPRAFDQNFCPLGRAFDLKINQQLIDFYIYYIFSIDKSILSLPTYWYSVGTLMIEVFKMVKSVKFIRNNGPREVRPLRIRWKNLSMGAGFHSF